MPIPIHVEPVVRLLNEKEKQCSPATESTQIQGRQQIGWLTHSVQAHTQTHTKRLCTGTHTFKNTALLIRPKQELFKKKKSIQQVILVWYCCPQRVDFTTARLHCSKALRRNSWTNIGSSNRSDDYIDENIIIIKSIHVNHSIFCSPISLFSSS